MPSNARNAENFYVTAPYDVAFDIRYPQENLPGELNKYRCKFCKVLTTEINGKLENHAQDCAYRLKQIPVGS